MKKFNLFAIGVIAMLMAALSVSATSANGYNPDCKPDNGDTCYAKIGENQYKTLAAAVKDAKNGDTIDVLDEIGSSEVGTTSTIGLFTSSTGLTTKLTINLADHTVDLDSAALYVGKAGNLTVKGTGELKNASGVLVTVSDATGSFTTEGGLLLTSAGNSVIATAGKVVVGTGAELAGTSLNASNGVVDVTARTADVTLNAKVGVSAAVSVPIVKVTGATPGARQTGAKVTFAGGEYKTSDHIMTVENGVVVTVSDGKYTSTATQTFIAKVGSLTINGGTIVSEGAGAAAVKMTGGKSTVLIDGSEVKMTAKGATVYTADDAEGSLTIKKGTITSTEGYALALASKDVTNKVEGATFNSKDNYPAIYIDDKLLTGMKKGGADDKFKAMLTGGRYLYMIVGEAVEDNGAPADYTADEVAAYIIADGLEQKTEGDYIVLGKGSGETQTPTPSEGQKPGEEQNPGETTNKPGVTNPDTLDNVTSVAAMGGISLAIAAAGIATLKKREN